MNTELHSIPSNTPTEMEFEPRPQIQFQVSNSRVSRVRPFKRLRIPVYVWPTLFTAFGGFLWGFDTGR